MIPCKPIIMEVAGTQKLRFSSISEASRIIGMSVPAIINRIVRKSVVGGVRFYYDTNPSSSESIPKAPKDTEITIPQKKVVRRHNQKSKPLNREKYAIVPYEKKHGVMCITKCTVVDFPQPFVGSVRCCQCPHHQGIDREAQEVACSNLFRK